MTVSNEMQVRLQKIKDHLSKNNLQVVKQMGFRPAIQSSSKSAAKAMPIGGDGAGFA